MSADSPRRTSRKGSTGHVVLPRPVTDPSLIDSLAGFIHEVVPQAYSSVLPGDNREAVVWAKFEQADYNDPSLYPDTAEDCDSTPPLLLVLGYVNGVQVWSVPASGEAVEVLSWNQRVVKTLKFLPAPESQRSSLHNDPFAHKRPLVALVDNIGPGPQFCSVSFISLHGGDQVKSIKFKNPINDVLVNRRSIVTTFPEKIAIFDALTLEDRMTVTTCYPCSGINSNPVSLGARWLAYADKRLVSWWRSQGGCEGDGAQSYTATMIHAAKSLGKGLRDLSGTVASSITGTGVPVNIMNGGMESCTPGVVTVVDIEGKGTPNEHVVAHFVAHLEQIVALSFDPSGLLLLTADKCGHRFHLFRLHPHPSGPNLCEVHHLYTLFRGDTTARVQDIAFSIDSRWVAVSSLRGTTHVFPITPYGGSVGVRTHTTPHVVNRLSRFHRSAGLSAEGGRNSPVAHDGPPLTPPLPPRTLSASHAITIQPLAQLRHQAATPSPEDAMVRLTACFAPPRACLPGLPLPVQACKNTRRALDSLYVMACQGRLIQYDLDPRHSSGIPKDRICDDTAVELSVDPKAEWILLRPPLFNPLQPPLTPSNPLLIIRPESSRHVNCMSEKPLQGSDEHWLSQVEIMTHAGPHRRLWMGPQFTFKTYNLTTSDVEKESVEVGSLPIRSNPVNMPILPHLLIESGSASSLEQSPHLTEVFENSLGQGESRLREDLADAMLESPGSGPRSTGSQSVWVVGGTKRTSSVVVERLVNPLGTVVTIDPEQQVVATASSSYSDPTIDGVSSIASQPVTDLIIVPARSVSSADTVSGSSGSCSSNSSNKQNYKNNKIIIDVPNVVNSNSSSSSNKISGNKQINSCIKVSCTVTGDCNNDINKQTGGNKICENNNTSNSFKDTKIIVKDNSCVDRSMSKNFNNKRKNGNKKDKKVITDTNNSVDDKSKKQTQDQLEIITDDNASDKPSVSDNTSATDNVIEIKTENSKDYANIEVSKESNDVVVLKNSDKVNKNNEKALKDSDSICNKSEFKVSSSKVNNNNNNSKQNKKIEQKQLADKKNESRCSKRKYDEQTKFKGRSDEAESIEKFQKTEPANCIDVKNSELNDFEKLMEEVENSEFNDFSNSQLEQSSIKLKVLNDDNTVLLSEENNKENNHHTDGKTNETCDEKSKFIEELITESKSYVSFNNNNSSDTLMVVEPAQIRQTLSNEKENLTTNKSNGNSSKNKRKCKTLGKKISKIISDVSSSGKVETGSDKIHSPKCDDMDLLESHSVKLTLKLNDVPDLLLSNSAVQDCDELPVENSGGCEETSEKQSNTDEYVVKRGRKSPSKIERKSPSSDGKPLKIPGESTIGESDLSEQAENLLKEVENITKEVSDPEVLKGDVAAEDVTLKTRSDETTDKDSSSDDCQLTSSKSDEKIDKKATKSTSVQKKRKSNRKIKENDDVENQSDSDTNIEKTVTSVTTSALPLDDSDKINECKSTILIDTKPKMSWSHIVSKGKNSDERKTQQELDANGNCNTNTELDSVFEQSVPLTHDKANVEFPDRLSSNDSEMSTADGDEKDTNVVKTNSTEDRCSIYESCSESVGEETTLEVYQQSVEQQEQNSDSNDDKINNSSDNEMQSMKLNMDENKISLCQNINDEEIIDKSCTDSGEKESDGNNQQSSKKSRKSKRKRR